MRDLEDEERIKEYMKAKMTHIKMYNECMNLVDGLDVEKFAELVRADEREACAKVADQWDTAITDKVAEAIRARGENPPVKTYCGGKPNYCTPEVTPEVTGEVTGDVDAVNMSQERVDETEKRKHNPWPSVQCVCGGTIYFKYTPPISDYHEGWEEGFKAAKREWVGLTKEEVHEVVSKKWWDWEDAFDIEGFSRAIEAKLKEKNSV